jgi:hypothetical protein
MSLTESVTRASRIFEADLENLNSIFLRQMILRRTDVSEPVKKETSAEHHTYRALEGVHRNLGKSMFERCSNCGCPREDRCWIWRLAPWVSYQKSQSRGTYVNWDIRCRIRFSVTSDLSSSSRQQSMPTYSWIKWWVCIFGRSKYSQPANCVYELIRVGTPSLKDDRMRLEPLEGEWNTIGPQLVPKG